MTGEATQKPRSLTVILRDDGPMIHCGDSPSYRSVQVELTPEQWEQIKPRISYTTAGTNYFEEISKCFIEPGSGEDSNA